MRFTYAETFCDPTYLGPLAQAAEEAGYHALAIPDSLIYPATSTTSYPYTPDGSREFLEGKPVIEPFVLIPYLAALTSRIRFTTFVVKLAVRPAVLVAKQAASIAVLSDNRLTFGIGLSPWPEDFAALDVPWAARGKRMDEQIEIIRGLTSGEGFFEHHGAHLDLEPAKICPQPTEPIPILIGGHSDAALRRAARVGDGWIHAGGGDGKELDGLLEKLGAFLKEEGREGDPFELHVVSLDAFSVDGVKKLEQAGVTDVVVGFRYPYTVEPDTQPLEEKVQLLQRFAEDVIART